MPFTHHSMPCSHHSMHASTQVMSEDKKIRVKASYEYDAGLRTVLHYPQLVKPCHQPYTCKPKTVRIKASYEYEKGLRTVLHYPQEIVLKHFVFQEQEEMQEVIIREIGPVILM